MGRDCKDYLEQGNRGDRGLTCLLPDNHDTSRYSQITSNPNTHKTREKKTKQRSSDPKILK